MREAGGHEGQGEGRGAGGHGPGIMQGVVGHGGA